MAMVARVMATASRVVGDQQQQGQWQQGWRLSNGNKGDGNGERIYRSDKL
jgi:hypothetical protein